ncbi:hypothetical protein RclHR1_10580006 [Rhizophagus clarus]|uniref:Protein kinase domain-containing protein n=1 Tax=Rhizophagus clarus TaxID=94130 RepID=A0A2Z6QT90_9GLOM|nr:hypothetical protein RclHR1_10580006 [Rhizophagus clarus]
MLVMEYADGGNLRSYLKNNFIPYVDPKSFNKQENNNNETQLYLLNEKWDVYSVDVLMWEISSGQPPFYTEGDSHEIYNWLLNNRNNSNSIFLLGYIYYQEIEASENDEKAFNLFIDASGTNHLLAQHFVGECYQYRYGVKKMKSVEKDLKMAFYWYEKASNYGNIKAMNNLGLSEGGDLGGITMLGYCYVHGIGTEIDKQKAFEFYQKSANLGSTIAQYNLGVMSNIVNRLENCTTVIHFYKLRVNWIKEYKNCVKE